MDPDPSWGEQTREAFEFLAEQVSVWRGKLPPTAEVSVDWLRDRFNKWPQAQLERAATVLNGGRNVPIPLAACAFIAQLIEAEGQLPPERLISWSQWFELLLKGMRLDSRDRVSVTLRDLLCDLVKDWEPTPDRARRIASVNEDAWDYLGVYPPTSAFPVEECWYRTTLYEIKGSEREFLVAVLEAVAEQTPEKGPSALLVGALMLARSELGNAELARTMPETFASPVVGLRNVFEGSDGDFYRVLRSFLRRALEQGVPMGPSLRAFVADAVAQRALKAPAEATEEWTHAAEGELVSRALSARHEIASLGNDDVETSGDPWAVLRDLARSSSTCREPVDPVPATCPEFALFFGMTDRQARNWTNMSGFPEPLRQRAAGPVRYDLVSIYAFAEEHGLGARPDFGELRKHSKIAHIVEDLARRLEKRLLDLAGDKGETHEAVRSVSASELDEHGHDVDEPPFQEADDD